jgi:quinol monooxygenase YgiN
MVHVLVRHKVSDFTRWKELFDSALNARMHAGELGFRLFQSVTDPRDVTLLLDWDSVEHARQFMGSDDLKTKMQAAGVVGTPEVQYLEDVRAVRRTSAD